MMDTILLQRDEKRQWRWTRKAENGEIVGASTESYVNKADALANIEGTQGGEFELRAPSVTSEDPVSPLFSPEETD